VASIIPLALQGYLKAVIERAFLESGIPGLRIGMSGVDAKRCRPAAKAGRRLVIEMLKGQVQESRSLLLS
jgi:hypothetical protein